MQLWIHWLSAVSLLRPACSRLRTFLWLTVCLSGISIRPDIFCVTSIVRAFGLKDAFYDRLLDFSRSPALNIADLTGRWVRIVLNIFPGILTVNGRLLIVGDGLKIPKSGKKMPAVKRLHQSSESNTKPQYITGHSCQAVAVLVGALQSVFAVPLASRIHEGLVFSNRDTKTLLDKMMLLVDSLGLPGFYFIADAYYSARKVMTALLGKGNHLVSQVRINAVAYVPAAATTRRKKGRPKKYADKIRLKTLFDCPDSMITAESPVYGEKGVRVRYRCADLLIKRLGMLVRFLAVIHPVRGRCILMCTDLSLPAINDKLYTFLTPDDKDNNSIRDIISIALVRIAQKGNVTARQEIIKLVRLTIDEWIEHNPRIFRWKGYEYLITKHIEDCIRRYRYSGSFMGYLFKTLEYAGRGLRPIIIHSLDDSPYPGGRKRIDTIGQNPETEEILIYGRNSNTP